MSLINSYTGGFRRCSTQKTACTLPCKEMQVQFQRLAGHGQWSWQQRFGAWGLSCNLKQTRLRKHNTKCRDSEVHQHIQALSRIWTKCGKKQFGKHPSHPACDAESVCTARSQNMTWLAGPDILVTLVVATSCTLFLERKLCSANSKRSPKASFDFSVCRLSNNPKATRSISAT